MREQGWKPQEIVLAPEERALKLAPTVAGMSAGRETRAFCVEYEPCDGAFLRELWQKLGCRVESISETEDSAVVRMNADQLLLVKSLDCLYIVSKKSPIVSVAKGRKRTEIKPSSS